MWLILNIVVFVYWTYLVNGTNYFERFDKVVSLFIHSIFNTKLAIFFSTMFSPELILVFVIIVSIYSIIKYRTFILFRYLITNTILAYLFLLFFKNVLKRNRPVGHLINETGWSYPSGHVLSAVLLVTTISLLLKNKQSEKIIFVVGIIFVVVICLARIAVYAHYPSDVIGGLLLGSIFSQIILGNKKELYTNI